MAKQTDKSEKPVKLQIANLSLESKTQQRVATSDDAVKEYAEAIRNGATLPPITVFFDGIHYYIADGWHRVLAYKEAGHSHIFAIITQGTLRDAIFHAAGANTSHGVRRTNADKRQAVMTLLDDGDWAAMSNAMIAAHCGVSDHTVARYRENLQPRKCEPQNTRTGKDGKEYPDTNSRKVRPSKNEPQKEVKKEIESEDDSFDPASMQAVATPVEMLAETYKSHVNTLLRIKRELVAMAEDERYGGYLHSQITRITTDLDSVKATVRQMQPMGPCDKCAAEGCKACMNTGFVTRAFVESRRK